MGGFSFAGEHSSTYSISLLRSPLSIFPGVREKVIVMTGRHGALRMIPDLGERTLQMECWLQAASRAEMYERLDRVRSWLNPMRGSQQLLFEETPDRYYLATCVAGGLNAEVTAGQGFFSLQMICSDPFSYAVVPDIVTVTTSPHQHIQRGTAPADPLLMLRGVSAGGNQSLAVKINEVQVTYWGPLTQGEQLEIDCRQKTAVIVKGEHRERVLPLLERPVFPQLVPGLNTVRILAQGGATWSRLEVHCRNRWL
ncbi:MAG: phage tail family protein [Peptococcaceae bacterium]|nr:phage tail family protein [Peptococcaceae bacterium]